MSHRVNVMLEDDVWEQLREVPQGDRSRLINEAISETLLRRRRTAAWASIRERASGKEKLPGTTEEWVCADRDSHR